jgi:Putative prokaryotic signal transducing protein
MPEDIVAIKIYADETEANMAQQLLEDSGVTACVFKDDAGGMEPHLQRTNGVRLLVNRADAERANEILLTMVSD